MAILCHVPRPLFSLRERRSKYGTSIFLLFLIGMSSVSPPVLAQYYVPIIELVPHPHHPFQKRSELGIEYINMFLSLSLISIKFWVVLFDILEINVHIVYVLDRGSKSRTEPHRATNS
jgi:hypothetical protein